MFLYDIRYFNPQCNLVGSNQNQFSHNVRKGTLDGSDKIWFCKEIEDAADAKSEILAQEFFRLIIPHQPETRLAYNYFTGTYYILSEEVQGYRRLPTKRAANFANGIFTGLGQALVVGMFLEEYDLKNGNVGLDAQNRVIKIDGDWAFAEFRNKGPFKLTLEAIENLPYPKDFKYDNWLDMGRRDKQKNKSSIVDANLSNSSQFRAEVNQALVKILLIPDSFIEAFVDNYLQAGGQRFVDLIKNRREFLTQSALKSNSFKDYLNSSFVKSDVQTILEHMKCFNNTNISIIPDYQQNNLVHDFLNHLGKNKELAKLNPYLGFECEQLINEIKFNTPSNQIPSYEDRLYKAFNLFDLKIELTQHLNHFQSIQLIKEFGELRHHDDDFIKNIEFKLSNPPCDYLAIKIELAHNLNILKCMKLLNEIKGYFDINDQRLDKFIQYFEQELYKPCDLISYKFELEQIVNYIHCRQLLWEIRTFSTENYEEYIDFIKTKLANPNDYAALKLELIQIANYLKSLKTEPLFEGTITLPCDLLGLKTELPIVYNYIKCREKIWEMKTDSKLNNRLMQTFIHAKELSLSMPCDYSMLIDEISHAVNLYKNGFFGTQLITKSQLQDVNISLDSAKI
ncbi:MAG: hypothetical protein H0U57_08780 [Tatlockia sp.]|nr:hypothetical protein [Tatlockia sp.]